MLRDEDDQKLVLIDSDQNFYMSFSGLAPDSHVIIEQARIICRNYRYNNGEDITLHQLASHLSDVKQKYTIMGGKRPFGIRSVLFGFEEGKAKAYIVEPDGNYSEYKGGAIGQKCGKVMEYLERRDSGDALSLSVGGLLEVVQSDANKMSSFRIYEDRIERVTLEEVSSLIEKLKKGTE
jgi:20S proteasome subunit alpha 4